MTRRNLAGGLAAPCARRPNAVLILIGDLRWDALGCCSRPWMEAPSPGRLAAGGARFANTCVTICLRSDSRASIRAGQSMRSQPGARSSSTSAPGTGKPHTPDVLALRAESHSYMEDPGVWDINGLDDDRRGPGQIDNLPAGTETTTEAGGWMRRVRDQADRSLTRDPQARRVSSLNSTGAARHLQERQ